MPSMPSAVSRQPSAESARRHLQSPAPSPQPLAPRAFTLVEMLVAMAITLVMMAAVVTLFANVSNSVRNRRATTEMAGALRHVRNTLQQDLQGATCPGETWQRPDSNHGYIELIEGKQNDQNPTDLARDLNGDGNYTGAGERFDLDPALSPIPRNNIGIVDTNANGKIDPAEIEAHYKTAGSLVPGGLGDHDDVLMFTVRNEHEPFVGRVPKAFDGAQLQEFKDWDYETIESTLAEVVWFCIENPPESEDPSNFFGEPGIRTIYRRALLIAPWQNTYRPNDSYLETFSHGGTFKAEPGLVRMLPASVGPDKVQFAIAAIIAFRDRYDLSVRLEWDHNIQRWKIMANTLADLTKRENRFGHFGFLPTNPPQRVFPYALLSTGRGYSGTPDVGFIIDPEIENVLPPSTVAKGIANLGPGGAVNSYSLGQPGSGYAVRPFAFVSDAPNSGMPSTAQAMMSGEEKDGSGVVVRIVHGPVPLWGARRGQDVMMTDVLGFDLRVYDPGAPLYLETTTQTVLQPADIGWPAAYDADVATINDTIDIVSTPSSTYTFIGQGAYVDLGYGFNRLIPKRFFSVGKSFPLPWYFGPQLHIDMAQASYIDGKPPQRVMDGGALSDIYASQLAPGYAVYDTWSFHYENNGVNEDGDVDASGMALIDEGTNGVDNLGNYVDRTPGNAGNIVEALALGVDDVGERETILPYDKPLRGIQVLIRAYEPDSRAIRQVRVNQHFLPE